MSTSVDHNLPLALCLNQSLDLPLPGGVVRPGALVWHAESKDPSIARVMLTSVALPREPPATARPAMVWHLNIKALKPGKTTIKVRETAETHPPKDQYKLTLEVNVLEQKQQSGAVWLSGDGQENPLKIGGDLGWFETTENPSARTHWTFTPDDSGVYELVDVVGVSKRPPVMGGGTQMFWQFRGVKEGHGMAVFQRYFAGEVAELVKIAITVVK